MDKRLKITAIVFLILLVVPLVSADLYWDNKKTFDNNVGEYGKVIVKDWYGLWNLKEATLYNNSEMCLDSGCQADLIIRMFQKGSLIDDIKFVASDSLYNQRDDIKDYSISYKINNIWVNYNLGDEVKGSRKGIDYEVKIEGNLYPFQKVDWIIETSGFFINEWAGWSSNLNDDLSLYYNFENEAENVYGLLNLTENGTVSYQSSNCIIGKCGNNSLDHNFWAILDRNLQPGGGDPWMNYTKSINFWVRPETLAIGTPRIMFESNAAIYAGAVVAGTSFNTDAAGGLTIGANTFISNVGLTNATVMFIPDTWTMFTATMTNSTPDGTDNTANWTIYINANRIYNGTNGTTRTAGLGTNLTIGMYFGGVGHMAALWDEMSFYNKTLSQAEISQLYNSGVGVSYEVYGGDHNATLYAPAPYENFTARSINFNCSGENNTVGYPILGLNLTINNMVNYTLENTTAGQSFIGINRDVEFELGDYNYSCETWGRINFNSSSTRNFSRVNGFNITLNSPDVDEEILGQSIEFNCSATNLTYTNSSIETILGINLTINNMINETLENSTADTLNLTLTKSVEGINYGNNNYSCEVWGDSSNYTSSTRQFSRIRWANYTVAIYNITSWDTATENYILNLSSDDTDEVTAQFFWNGTEYTATKAGDNKNMSFASSLTIVEAYAGANASILWQIAHGTNYTNHSVTSTDINETIFTFCNTTWNTPFINFTFRDESDSSVIDGAIPSSTFNYWIGDGSVWKTYIFSNSTNNTGYGFCCSANETINNNISIQYSSTGYPQRKWLGDTDLTNVTTNEILYLLATADGIYTSIQVVEAAGGGIVGVEVTIERQISGVWTIIGTGNTDDSGLITFWVNPNYNHRITAIKTGYASVTVTIQPTQTLYTLTMSATDVSNITYTDELPGVSWQISPRSGELNNGTWNFNSTVFSSQENIVNCSFELLNATNVSQVLAFDTERTNITYCFNDFNYTTIPDQNLFGKLSIHTTESGGLVVVDSDWAWIVLDIQIKGWRGLVGFFSELKDLSEFGEGNKAEFSKFVFFFVLVTILMGTFIYLTGVETSNPGISIIIIWIIVITASIGGFLTFNSGLGEDAVTEAIEQYSFLLIYTIFAVGWGLSQFRRATD